MFEITETALIQDEVAARHFAERLHALGCKLALDDFGTGYGGFTYLKQLPLDYLKIDIEFVRDLATNPASSHVVQAVVALARGFSLQTVAEGVEDAETLELLRELGVDLAQGYHIAKPGPLAESVNEHTTIGAPRVTGHNEDQRRLEQEQALSDLDQSIADREQALADADQAAIERAQLKLDDERAAEDPTDFALSVGFAHRQSEMDRRQERNDARQDQVDQAQTGGDDRQTLLDGQQHELEQPATGRPDGGAAAGRTGDSRRGGQGAGRERAHPRRGGAAAGGGGRAARAGAAGAREPAGRLASDRGRGTLGG